MSTRTCNILHTHIPINRASHKGQMILFASTTNIFSSHVFVHTIRSYGNRLHTQKPKHQTWMNEFTTTCDTQCYAQCSGGASRCVFTDFFPLFVFCLNRRSWWFRHIFYICLSFFLSFVNTVTSATPVNLLGQRKRHRTTMHRVPYSRVWKYIGSFPDSFTFMCN